MLLQTVAELNNDPRFHGVLIQLPLPDAIDPLRIIESLDPMKDVDGIHPANLGASRRRDAPVCALPHRRECSNSSCTTGMTRRVNEWLSADAAR